MKCDGGCHKQEIITPADESDKWKIDEDEPPLDEGGEPKPEDPGKL